MEADKTVWSMGNSSPTTRRMMRRARWRGFWHGFTHPLGPPAICVPTYGVRELEGWIAELEAWPYLGGFEKACLRSFRHELEHMTGTGRKQA